MHARQCTSRRLIRNDAALRRNRIFHSYEELNCAPWQKLGFGERCFPSSSGSQIVQNVPCPCDSTNRAMILSTSGSGEPAKINFSRLRTVSIENSPALCSDGSSRDRIFAGNSIALSMEWSPGLLDSPALGDSSAVSGQAEVRLSRAVSVVPTSAASGTTL